MKICELMECCFNNNIKGIKTLLECGVNDEDKHHLDMLLDGSIYKNSNEIIEILINSGLM